MTAPRARSARTPRLHSTGCWPSGGSPDRLSRVLDPHGPAGSSSGPRSGRGREAASIPRGGVMSRYFPAALVVLLAVAASAQAADKGFYLGASVGQATTKDVTDDLDFDADDTGFKAFA